MTDAVGCDVIKPGTLEPGSYPRELRQAQGQRFNKWQSQPGQGGRGGGAGSGGHRRTRTSSGGASGGTGPMSAGPQRQAKTPPANVYKNKQCEYSICTLE